MSAHPTTAMGPAPPPSAVACLRCGRAFLAPTDQPAAVIECPCCGAQARREELLAPPPASEPHKTGATHGTWTVALAALLALAVLGAVGVGLQWFRPNARRAAAPAADLPASDLRRVNDILLQEARAVADRALSCPDWLAARPLVLDADRVAPMMEKYHARHPWIPMTLVGAHEGTITTTTADRTRTARVSVHSNRGSLLTLHLQDTPDGWKLDWERLINARHFAWVLFHEDQPTSPVALHVLALRGSADDAAFARAGLTPETGLAVRLDGPRPGLPTLAIMPKASDLGRLFQRELTWQQPRPYRCQLRLVDPHQVPPRVEITSFTGEGWEP